MTTSGRHLLKVRNALFKAAGAGFKTRGHVFLKPIDSFDIKVPENSSVVWGITGPAKAAFLNMVAAQYVAQPPLSRTYPSFSDVHQSDQIQYLNFRDNSGLDKVHMAARYESYSYKGKLEMSDDVNSVRNYITGANNYNSNFDVTKHGEFVDKLLDLFNLRHLSGKWINSLSNGQMRRARIAKSLINKPGLIVIDDPFLGLDPQGTVAVGHSLKLVADELNAGLVIGLRVQDEVPEWVDLMGYVDSTGLRYSGGRGETSEVVRKLHKDELELLEAKNSKARAARFTEFQQSPMDKKDPIIEFNNASVAYKGLDVLKDFLWTVERGSRWRILGENGSGKTTILSLITADHPQSWRSVLSIDGETRKSGQGITRFDVNNRIGISLPELHANVPGDRIVKDLITNGLVKDVGNGNFMFAYKGELPEHARQMFDTFAPELKGILNKPFRELTVSQQKLVLFLRAAIKKPDILILDEAFSCMDSEAQVLKCHDYVDKLPLTVLAIAHVDWEMPNHEHVIKLHGDSARGYTFYRSG